MMKIGYKFYFGLSLVFLILFIFLLKDNLERRYAFLGLAIGSLARGIYEMNKQIKSRKENKG